MSTLYGAAAVDQGGAAFGFEVSVAVWGYDLRGSDVLEVTARIAEEGGNADLNGPPLWDHPEWLEGWYRDGRPWTPPPRRALPYVPGSAWTREGSGGLGMTDIRELLQLICVAEEVSETLALLRQGIETLEADLAASKFSEREWRDKANDKIAESERYREALLRFIDQPLLEAENRAIARAALADNPKTEEPHPAGCGGTYYGVGFVGPDFTRWRARCINHGNRLVEGPRGGPYEYIDDPEKEGSER